MKYKPQSGVVLVRLNPSNYGKDVYMPEKTYDSVTSGEIAGTAEKDNNKELIGKTGYWRLYKDDCRLEGENGEKLAFIEIKDLLGFSE